MFQFRLVSSVQPSCDIPRLIKLAQPTTLIGRNPQTCQVVLDSKRVKASISRLHARVSSSEGSIQICDLSMNGVFVNNIRIPANKPISLNEGDLITFGGGGKMKPGTNFRQPQSEFNYIVERAPEKLDDRKRKAEPEKFATPEPKKIKMESPKKEISPSVASSPSPSPAPVIKAELIPTPAPQATLQEHTNPSPTLLETSAPSSAPPSISPTPTPSVVSEIASLPASSPSKNNFVPSPDSTLAPVVSSLTPTQSLSPEPTSSVPVDEGIGDSSSIPVQAQDPVSYSPPEPIIEQAPSDDQKSVQVSSLPTPPPPQTLKESSSSSPLAVISSSPPSSLAHQSPTATSPSKSSSDSTVVSDSGSVPAQSPLPSPQESSISTSNTSSPEKASPTRASPTSKQSQTSPSSSFFSGFHSSFQTRSSSSRTPSPSRSPSRSLSPPSHFACGSPPSPSSPSSSTPSPQIIRKKEIADDILAQKSAETQLNTCSEILISMKEHLNTFRTQINNPLRVDAWQEDLSRVINTCMSPETVIAVLGDTGAGKSSLINSILGEEDILPTSGMRACTAVVTEISALDMSQFESEEDYHYEADIHFLEEDEWDRELRSLLSDAINDKGKPKRIFDPKSDVGVSMAKIITVYGSCAPYEVLKYKRDITRHLGTVKKIREQDPKTFRKILDNYVDSTSDDAAVLAGRTEKKAFWPIVKKVQLRGPFESLKTGVRLVDLPGVRDSNAARDAIAREYLKTCEVVWIVANITRAVDDKTAKDLLGETFRRQLMMDGKMEGNLAFIATKTDVISVSETVRAFGLEDEVRPLEEKLEEFRANEYETQNQIQEKSYEVDLNKEVVKRMKYYHQLISTMVNRPSEEEDSEDGVSMSDVEEEEEFDVVPQDPSEVEWDEVKLQRWIKRSSVQVKELMDFTKVVNLDWRPENDLQVITTILRQLGRQFELVLSFHVFLSTSMTPPEEDSSINDILWLCADTWSNIWHLVRLMYTTWDEIPKRISQTRAITKMFAKTLITHPIQDHPPVNLAKIVDLIDNYDTPSQEIRESFEEIKEFIEDLIPKGEAQIRELEPEVTQLTETSWMLNSQIENYQRTLSGICARARNSFSKTQIEIDFRKGRREMIMMAKASAGKSSGVALSDFEMEELRTQIEEEEEEHEGEDEEEGGGSIDVFAVSSYEYLKLIGKLQRDGQTKTFEDAEDTEVPALLRFISDLSERRRNYVVERAFKSTEHVLTAIHTYLSDSGTQCQVLRESILQSLQRKTKELKGTLQLKVVRMEAVLDDLINRQLCPKIREGVNLASTEAMALITNYGRTYNSKDKKSGGLHFSTYRAMVRRDGVYTSPTWGVINIPEEFAEPVYRIFSVFWDRIFSSDLPRILKDLNAHFKADILRTFEVLANEVILLGVESDRVKRLKPVLLDYVNHRLSHLFESILSSVKDQQKDVSRVVAPHIQEKMLPGFLRAKEESGPGCYARIKGHIHAHTEKERLVMFDQAVNILIKDLKSLETSIHTMVKPLNQHCISFLVSLVEPLCSSKLQTSIESLKKLAPIVDDHIKRVKETSSNSIMKKSLESSENCPLDATMYDDRPEESPHSKEDLKMEHQKMNLSNQSSISVKAKEEKRVASLSPSPSPSSSSSSRSSSYPPAHHSSQASHLSPSVVMTSVPSSLPSPSPSPSPSFSPSVPALPKNSSSPSVSSAEVPIENMKVSELKNELKKKKIDFSGCIEKSELVGLLQKSSPSPFPSPSPSPSSVSSGTSEPPSWAPIGAQTAPAATSTSSQTSKPQFPSQPPLPSPFPSPLQSQVLVAPQFHPSSSQPTSSPSSSLSPATQQHSTSLTAPSALPSLSPTPSPLVPTLTPIPNSTPTPISPNLTPPTSTPRPISKNISPGVSTETAAPIHTTSHPEETKRKTPPPAPVDDEDEIMIVFEKKGTKPIVLGDIVEIVDQTRNSKRFPSAVGAVKEEKFVEILKKYHDDEKGGKGEKREEKEEDDKKEKEDKGEVEVDQVEKTAGLGESREERENEREEEKREEKSEEKREEKSEEKREMKPEEKKEEKEEDIRVEKPAQIEEQNEEKGEEKKGKEEESIDQEKTDGGREEKGAGCEKEKSENPKDGTEGGNAEEKVEEKLEKKDFETEETKEEPKQDEEMKERDEDEDEEDEDEDEDIKMGEYELDPYENEGDSDSFDSSGSDSDSSDDDGCLSDEF